MVIKVGIFGAASLTAGKLIELLLNHPKVKITFLASDTYNGKDLEASFRGKFKNLIDIKFEKYNKKKMISKCDVVFLSKPHGKHVNIAEELLQEGIKVIDLSADFRLKDVKTFAEWYKIEDSEDSAYYYGKDYFKYLNNAVYGLPEIYSDKIANATLIANPGCYPTSVILGVAPLFKNRIALNDNIIVDSYSGVSGAGKSREKETQFIDLNENIKPYKLGTHAHTPEMEQELSSLYGADCKVLFTPHVMPIDAGIVSTIYIKLAKQFKEKELLELYEDFYENKKFVRIYGENSLPYVKDVINTNFCDIGITIDDKKPDRTNLCIITSVIDNTIKGAAGQAIQNMNLMFGIDESEGLPFNIALKSHTIKSPDFETVENT